MTSVTGRRIDGARRGVLSSAVCCRVSSAVCCRALRKRHLAVPARQTPFGLPSGARAPDGSFGSRAPDGSFGAKALYGSFAVGLILVAFAIRAYDLDARSLWLDEGFTFYRATKDVAFILTNHIIIDGVVTTDLHPPLYFLLLHWVLQVAGAIPWRAMPFVARLFSVLASLPSLSLLYLIGRRLGGKLAGLFAVLTGCLAPVYLWYGQEARPYALVVSLSLLSVYALLRLVAWYGSRAGRFRWAVVYCLATAATVYTHYSGLFLLGFEGLFLLALVVQHRWRAMEWRWLTLLLVGAVALISPVMPFVIHRMGLGAEYAYSFVPLGTILKDLANSLSLGLSVRAEQVWWVDGLFLLIAFVGLVDLVQAGRWRWALWVVAYLAVPTLILYGASYIKPMYMLVRHLLIISPAYYLALGLGLAALARWHRLALVAGLVVILMGTGYSIQNYFTDPTYLKDDHRGLARYLEEHVRPGDVVVVDGPIRADVLLDFYYDGIAPLVVPLPYTVEPGPETLATLQTLANEYDRIWFAYGIPGDGWVTPDGERPIHTWRERDLFQFTQTYFHGFGEAISLYGYLTQSPVLTPMAGSWALPPQAVPLGADLGSQFTLGPQLTLVGVELPEEPVVAGEPLDFTAYWRPQQPLKDYRVALSLLDENGQQWGMSDQMPFEGFFPPSQWSVGAIVAWRNTLRVDPMAPPGRYALGLRVYAPASGQALDLIGPDGNPAGQQIDLGTVHVVRPEVPPDRDAANAIALPRHWRPQHPLSARWVGGLRLLGFDLVSQTFEAGDRVPLSLYYLVDQALEHDYQVRIGLVDPHRAAPQRDGGREVPFEIELPPVRADYPTSQWRAGDLLKGQHIVVLPPDLPPSDYRLQVSLVRPDADGSVPVRYGWLPFRRSSVSLITIHVRAPDRVFHAPSIQHSLDVQFGDAISLLGYDLAEGRVHPDDTVEVTLYWQARATLAQSYKVTVQLLSDDQRIVGQDDAVPAHWTRPTTGWLPGEVVTDSHSVPVATDTAPGRYNLIVALYDEQTGGHGVRSGQRLPVTTGDRTTDYARLAELVIESQ